MTSIRSALGYDDHGCCQMDLWTADADGSNPVQLTHDPSRYSSYAWADSCSQCRGPRAQASSFAAPVG